MPTGDNTDAVNPQIVSAAAFRKPQGFPVQLPSNGFWVMAARTMSLINMMRTGSIPNPLGKHIKSMIDKKQFKFDAETIGEAATRQMLILVDESMPAILIQPRCEAPPQEIDGRKLTDAERDAWRPADPEVISTTELDWQDKFFLFAFGQGAVSDLASFRDTEQALAAAQNGEGVLDLPSTPAQSE